jgi:hypothetical protein
MSRPVSGRILCTWIPQGLEQWKNTEKASQPSRTTDNTVQIGHFSIIRGLDRTPRSLLNLNQKKGFDCPSCAWPDPDGERKTAEFCENGAKAVASEATTKRLTPQEFAKHPNVGTT